MQRHMIRQHEPARDLNRRPEISNVIPLLDYKVSQTADATYRRAFARRIERLGGPTNLDSQAVTVVRVLTRVLEETDGYTWGHSSRVSNYAARMAEELGLTRSEIREIKLAGELHDIGKLAIPEELLSKEGPLTEEEYAKVMEHTVLGARMLRSVFNDRSAVMSVVRWHHERFDGQGAPDGLAGYEIPLSARIVAVADAFDAMTSARSYRNAVPLHVAIEELDRNNGTQFDPDCVRALFRLVCPGRILREAC